MQLSKSSETIPNWLLESGESRAGSPIHTKTHFLRGTMKNIAGILENDLYCERYASKDSFLQMIDPRVKLCVFLVFLVFGSFAGNPAVLTVLAAIPIAYAGLSGVPVGSFLRRIWMIVPLAVFVVSLPGASSLLIQGRPLFYFLPQGAFGLREGLYFTAGGLVTAFRLTLRAGISLSFAFLLLLTTRWQKITSALASLHIPAVFITILNMAYRYIFLLAEIVQEMMEARFLRTTGKLTPSDNRRFMSHSAAHLFLKGHFTGEEIYEAMCCRGYVGDSAVFTEFSMERSDLLFILINAVILFLLFAGEHLK